MTFYEDNNGDLKVTNIIIAIFIGIIAVVGIVWIINLGSQSYSRRQALLDTKNQVIISQMNANNQVQLNEIQIQQTKQLIQVETQKAEIKVAEAKGIAEAQKIINATLTDKYLQHEAISAQEKMANSPNHTTIYIPSGQNGIPIVKTIE